MVNIDMSFPLKGASLGNCTFSLCSQHTVPPTLLHPSPHATLSQVTQTGSGVQELVDTIPGFFQINGVLEREEYDILADEDQVTEFLLTRVSPCMSCSIGFVSIVDRHDIGKAYDGEERTRGPHPQWVGGKSYQKSDQVWCLLSYLSSAPATVILGYPCPRSLSF